MKIVISLLIVTVINFILFVPSSPVNLLLYLIKENKTFFLLADMAISNLIFLAVYKLLNKVNIGKK